MKPMKLPSALAKIHGKVSIGDWIHLPGTGFDIYGKIVAADAKTGEIEVVTSTITTNPSKIQPGYGGGRGEFRKIPVKDVPKKARILILSRISNPPKPKPGEMVDPPSPPAG
ncbi:MAG: hypothetical protein ACYSYU_11405 [Planctomycetota bacterium]|jgi:hypothetical protein